MNRRKTKCKQKKNAYGAVLLDKKREMCYTHGVKKSKGTKNMQIKGVIFDMDGTLVDSLVFWDLLWEEITRRYTAPMRFVPDEIADRAVRTITFAESMAFLHRHHGIAESADELCRVGNDLLVHFYETQVELKRGVREYLEYCRQNGIKMCIASAGNLEHIELAMAHCGIREYFSGVISCKTVGKDKSHPDVFFAALEHLGTKKEETYVIEDSIVALRTAHRAGFPTVGVYDRHGFDHEEMQAISDVYIGEGEGFDKLISQNG